MNLQPMISYAQQPEVLVVEATIPDSSAESQGGWEDYVLDSGCLFTLFDGLNRY